MAAPFKPCALDGCNGNASGDARGARGFCNAHYLRLLRHGSPGAGARAHGEAYRWLNAHVNYAGSKCLIWPFARFASGSAQVRFRGRSNRASRAMCILAHGEPPFEGAQAAHSCGNDHLGCVNPQHLRWDTAKGNCADRVRHGTENRGERQWGSKLTAQDVREIRRLAGSELQRVTAARFGVSRQAVTDILAGRSWYWLD